MTDMTEKANKPAAESSLCGLVRDFVVRASGNDERLAALCRNLLAEEAKGNVCMRLRPEETDMLRGKSPLVSIAPDRSGSLFVLSPKSNLLYTRRNWCYEDTVRRRIGKMAQVEPEAGIEVPTDGAFANLNVCQREAIARMISRKFTILTGGPGTGKTYTIARAVKLIRDRKPELRLGLAAPTGKAAARINEAMRREAEALNMDGISSAVTLDSLLLSEYDLVTYKHDRKNPLELDWLIVDEASMVSLPLMAKMLDALPEECRLTLVGDADQLSSVEPGRVFGDLCDMNVVNANGCKCELRESKRFPPDGEIARLADAVNRGDWEYALKLLREPGNRNIRYIELGKNGAAVEPEQGSFMGIVKEKLVSFCAATAAAEALDTLNDCRILCVLRHGRYGCEKLNREMLKRLRRDYPQCPIPVMITKNNSTLGVSNGDVGVVIPCDGASSSASEGLSLPADGGNVREIPFSLLPDREMAFATTVHKAQGSEFRNVVLVLPELPEDAPARSLLTRELFYTALTRTGDGVFFIYADDDTIKECCKRKTARRTGLQEAEGLS